MLDIEKSVSKACGKVLQDHDIAIEAIIQRAEGMRIIGECFLAEAEFEEHSLGVADARHTVEEAIRCTMQKTMDREDADPHVGQSRSDAST